MSPTWTLLELRMMGMMVTTGAIRRAKLPSNRHHEQTLSFFTGRMPNLLPNQQCQSSEWKASWFNVQQFCWSSSSYALPPCQTATLSRNTSLPLTCCHACCSCTTPVTARHSQVYARTAPALLCTSWRTSTSGQWNSTCRHQSSNDRQSVMHRENNTSTILV